jgi:HK97 family phage portal protein
MRLWPFGRREARASLENPAIPISSREILNLLGSGTSAAGVSVTLENALGVPAVWAAVNFLAGTLAGLPLHAYEKTEGGRKRIQGGIQPIVHDAPNDEQSSFEWRKGLFESALTTGRGLSYIERTAGGRVVNIWPMDPAFTTVAIRNGRKVYDYRGGGTVQTYGARDIIDLPFMLKADRVGVYSPILKHADAIGLAIAVTQYGAKYFADGGVPPFVMTGPMQSAGALSRSADDLSAAVRKAAQERRLALSLPTGHTITTLGGDPEKAQMVETQRWSVEQVARIYQLPPTFLQDLTHGTQSNSEQQDLHFVKHTLKRWIEQFEQELNLKLFGRAENAAYIEMNVDGLLRGDFQTRFEGYAKAVQSAIMTPNEIRERENLPSGGAAADALHIQGATVPLGSQTTAAARPSL